ncbi:MAG: bacillithiol biosynthesis cysteine-adding enzyme BshC [Candidatus Sumerlaeia bacterium]|nr:bacillithiol biosynthesis cysteine-adding enzyme BshC [Candidatus Sumerlaeia bacterium]
MSGDQGQITSAMKWQEAWKSGNRAVVDFHASPPWEFPESVRNTSRPLDTAAIEEWKNLLKPHAGDHDLSPLDQMKDPATRVVVTGQQAGALMGPLYVVYKALAARHWAMEYTKRHGTPCLALFWVASDDHDLEEIATGTWLDKNDNLLNARISRDDSTGKRSVFHEGLNATACGELLRELRETTPETEFREAILADIEASLAQDNFEAHFLELLCRWLLPLGIYPIVPRLGFLRRGSVSLFKEDLEGAGRSSGLVREAGERIARLGLTPPLHREGNELNFFLEVEGIRCRLVLNGDMVIAQEPGSREGRGSWSTAELASLAEAQPHRISPNAMMRPLVQDLLLPTVAYIAGPTELVYHGQIGELYDHFKVPRPAVFPRPNVFLLEPRQARALGKFAIDPVELLATGSHDTVLDALRSLSTSGNEEQILQEHRQRIDRELEQLAEYLATLGNDTAIERAMEKLRQGTHTGLDKLEERHRVFIANRDSNLVAAREKITAGLFPSKIPQERAISMISPLLINHGPGILRLLGDKLDYTAAGFQVLEVARLGE